MADLLLYNRKVETVFDLLGTKEDDISFSFAWCLKKSPELLSALLSNLFHEPFKKEDIELVKIMLQATEQQNGRTDFEIVLNNYFAIIIEAKKGWLLPTLAQLEKYAGRNVFSDAERKLIVSLSECKQFYADCYLPKKAKDITVVHLPFLTVSKLIANAKRRTSKVAERHILEQFHTYLNRIYKMQKLDSNYVFVVSLGSGNPDGWNISWIDIVKKLSRYFHPVGNGWPYEPPNYIAFRYDGKLQSIHHIQDYEVSKNLPNTFLGHAEPCAEHEPHFVYHLGPGFSPYKEVRSGKKLWNKRVWCMLDTLFTNSTVEEAHKESKARWELIQNQ